MDRERWRQIDTILKSALDRAPEDRAAFVERACGDDEGLRREVESLLAHERGESFLPTKPLAAFAAVAEEIFAARADDAAARPRASEGRPPSSPPSSGSIDEARFVPGDVLADRYRIAGLLGRGGMGEVYRADDLKLRQSVALKLLPERLASDGAALARFYQEVSVARQISHRNVCRVYDIGEASGLHFISMEYVRGEELSSVLKRFGRLPHDKAVEVSRQLCAGLAAIHEKGVLHRDLKPANVMIDERGDVRITDFGLAGLAQSFSGREALAGTPAYMSPEQLAGGELDARSDLYSLGLVFYELFTGRRAFEARTLDELLRLRQTTTTPTSPSSLVKDLDPVVERVIERCLEKEPARRPASAMQVAAALPGGDPLAAALAAGETPSPEMVAAAPREGVLRPAVAVALLATVLAAMFFIAASSKRVALHRIVPLDKPPDVLRDRAAEIAKRFGYDAPPLDTADGFGADSGYLAHVERNDPSPRRWDRLATGRPPAIFFWHRRSPRHLEPNRDFFTRPDDPPNDVPGMVRVSLDTAGRLFYFEAVPQTEEPTQQGSTQTSSTQTSSAQTSSPQMSSTQSGSTQPDLTQTSSPTSGAAQSRELQPIASQPVASQSATSQSAASQPVSSQSVLPQSVAPEWAALLREAGFDPASLRAAESKRTPPHAYDARGAWEGAYPEAPDVPFRVEAASYRGRPVYFEIVNAWASPSRQIGTTGSATEWAGLWLLLVLFFGTLLAGAALAWRNLRLGRGDRRGAFRLALFIFVTRLVYWASITHHSPTIGEVTNLLVRGIQSSVFWACFVGLLYLGLEPFLRRRWPERLISWSRLLAGDWRDPLVGRDLLIGAAFGMGVCACFRLADLLPLWAGLPPNRPDIISGIHTTLMPRGFLPFLMNQIDASLAFTFIITFVLLFLSMLLRSNRLGIAAGWLLLSFITVLLTASGPGLSWLLSVAAITLYVVVVTRYGLLAMASALLFQHLIVFFPVTTDLSAWYATNFILDAAFLIAVAAYGLYASLGGQPLFKRALLEE